MDYHDFFVEGRRVFFFKVFIVSMSFFFVNKCLKISVWNCGSVVFFSFSIQENLCDHLEDLRG